MRNLAPMIFALVALSACSSSNDKAGVRVLCEFTEKTAGIDTRFGVVTSDTTRRVEFTAESEDAVRKRLQEMGLGTAEKPCAKLEISPVSLTVRR